MAVRAAVWAAPQLWKGAGWSWIFQINVMCFNSLVILSRFLVCFMHTIQSIRFSLLKRCEREVLENYLPLMWDLILLVLSIPHCGLSPRKSQAKPAVLDIPQPRRLPQRLCLDGDFPFDKQADSNNLSLSCMSSQITRWCGLSQPHTASPSPPVGWVRESEV